MGQTTDLGFQPANTPRSTHSRPSLTVTDESDLALAKDAAAADRAGRPGRH